MDLDRPSAPRLADLDRALLALPLIGGLVFGILPFATPAFFAGVTGYAGEDAYVYRLAGAATFGYAVALLLGMRNGDWLPLRNVVIAVFVFNLGSVFACFIELATARTSVAMFAILITSMLIVRISAGLLAHYPGAPEGGDVARWVVLTTTVAALAAFVFGVVPYVPELSARPLGYTGTDAFLWRQAGSATLGYAVMGIFELRAPRWEVMRLPTIMALVFNGLAFVASCIEIQQGAITPLVALVAPASLAFTIATAAALIRKGR
ncbi:MAG: hypothetical protein HY071_00275 [Chloroflexi bacterium]|nr:hypothetical protein [Chloroflexota bacterium]